MMTKLKASASTTRPEASIYAAPKAIFWIGLLVRVLYITLAHTYRIRLMQDHFQFGWEMGRIARALVTGYGYADPFNGHSGPTAWTPPLYPLLLAGVFKVFGIYTPFSAWVILTINSIFSAATALAVYEIAARCYATLPNGRSIALWSGWLWALYPGAMQYSVRWVWEMSLSAFFFAWIITIALRVRRIGELPEPAVRTMRGQDRAQWAIYGLLWGLVALSNSSLLIFLPFCTLWMIWGDWSRSRSALLPVSRPVLRLLANVSLAGLMCVLCVVPWIARNARVFHAFVPMRANFGAELYESALPENRGFPWMATLPLAETSPDFQRYKRVGELAYSKQQGERGKAILLANKEAFAHHVLKRIYFFWSSVPHPVEKSFLNEFSREFFFAFTSLGGLFGLALSLRRRVPGAWLFAGAFAAVPLVYYVITVQARFRHPLEPLIMVLSVFLFQSADRSRTWSWQSPRQSAGRGYTVNPT